ncbi:hypothetical protein EYF80_058415 [Liparis tanakae]|uniref:Uncharacterized protein n=1 Tax=Liparis tanakae TaxID=230148 RepID=A0A4Z2ERN0_9TELE|nr:hypothetical protein EYF80_058415 [Liparis tanakae]
MELLLDSWGGPTYTNQTWQTSSESEKTISMKILAAAPKVPYRYRLKTDDITVGEAAVMLVWPTGPLRGGRDAAVAHWPFKRAGMMLVWPTGPLRGRA